MDKPSDYRYFILNKPNNMVSQFISSHNVVLLGEIDYIFPEGIHAIGRLDNNSEGLLILTTDKTITKKLFQGERLHIRKYLVQVKNIVTTEVINKLQTGVYIQVKGGSFYKTIACEAEQIMNPYDYVNQIKNENKYELTSWLLISLTEGKFHQVRKMVNAVGHKCKRLIRISIEDLSLDNLQPGAVKEIEKKDFFRMLKIEN